MAARWPDALPQAPLISAYDESPPDTALRTQMDAGPAKTRQRFTGGVRPVTWGMVLGVTETEILDEFYTQAVFGGTASFVLIDPRTKIEKSWRFTGPPKYTALSGDMFSVKCQMEMMPGSAFTPGGTVANVVPPGGTTGQRLTKASNNDYDTYWADSNVDPAQLPNKVKSGPAAGTNAALPTYRSLVKLDLPSDVAYLDVAQSFTFGMKQTFGHTLTTAGLNIAKINGSPSAPVDGDFWYDGNNAKLLVRENGVTYNIVNAGENPNPGPGQYYGTDSGGTKGYYTLPSLGTGGATQWLMYFGRSKAPTDLPTNGLVPQNWDAPTFPPINYQFLVGQGMDYMPADTTNPLWGHGYVYVGTTNSSTGWSDIGLVTGPVGPPGPTGAQGLVGPQGFPGPQGPQGNQGSQGIDGPQGVQGLQGVDGDQGIQGPQGPQGVAGDDATAITLIGNFGNSKTPADLPTSGLIPINWDATGSPSVAHQMVVGEALQYSLSASSDPHYNHLYTYVSTAENPSGWIDSGALAGAIGPQGPQGPQGNQGAAGTAGPQGVQGLQGDPGVGVPAGGNPGQYLYKNSIADYDTSWSTLEFPPPGGGANQVLGKASPSDFDYAWIGPMLPLAGGVLTGNLSAPRLIVTGAAATQRAIEFDTTGLGSRWQILAESTAESGANAGSNLLIGRYSDTGAFIDIPFRITRSTGQITISLPAGAGLTNFPRIDGPAGINRGLLGTTNGVNRWQITLGNAAAESTGNVGSDFQIARYSDTGTFIDSPLSINRATGAVTIGTSGGVNLALNKGTATSNNNIISQTAGLNRWVLNMATGGGESGGNVGSDFNLSRYSDAGTLIDTPLTISRAMGVVSIGPSSYVGGAPAVGASTLALNKSAAGFPSQILGTAAGVTRWSFTLGNGSAESGSNVGSDLTIGRFNDAGNFIDTPITINRANGMVSVTTGGSSGGLMISSAAATQRTLYFATAGSLRWQIMAEQTAEGGGNAGSNFAINRWSDAGGFLDAPLSINRANGQATFAQTINISSSIGASLIINTLVGNARNLAGQSGGINRWVMYLGAGGAEGGSNTGADFRIDRFSDAGTQIDSPLAITRSTGNVTIPNNLTVSGIINGFQSINLSTPTPLTRQFLFSTGGAARWQHVCNGAAESGSNAGSDFQFNAYNDAGVSLGAVFSVVRATRVVSFAVAIVNGPSDRSLKENIQPLTNSLAKVLQLQGVSFNFIGDEKPHIGLIAQDVEPIVPEVIQDYNTSIPAEKEGEFVEIKKMALDYPKLVALLIESIKELTQRVVELEAKAAA
jgi:hypothetical protein